MLIFIMVFFNIKLCFFGTFEGKVHFGIQVQQDTSVVNITWLYS